MMDLEGMVRNIEERLRLLEAVATPSPAVNKEYHLKRLYALRDVWEVVSKTEVVEAASQGR